MAQCTAKSKQSDERCKRVAAPGRTVCAIHGCKTPGGAVNPRFRTGRYSKDLPPDLQERYQGARADTNRLALLEEIALVDTKLGHTIARIDTGATKGLISWLREQFKLFMQFERERNAQGMADTLTSIERRLRRAANALGQWDEVIELIEERRKRVESERKRQVEVQQYVLITQVFVYTKALQDALSQAVIRHIAGSAGGSAEHVFALERRG